MAELKKVVTTSLDVPKEYLHIDDKIAQIERLHHIQVARKKESLSNYSLDTAIEELITAMLLQSKRDLIALEGGGN